MEYNDQPPFLSKGSKVEVWSEEEGFTNALFSAEILRPPPTPPPYSPTGRKRKKTTAVVKYDRMVSAEDGEPLVETVETRFLRPIPPPDIPDRPFELNEVVDAFHRDIWWIGFVVKVVNDRYTVAFKRPLDLLEFGRADMRPHWDWVGSKWVRPEKEDTTALIYTPGIEVEVNRHDEVPCRAWLPATVVGQVGYTSFLVRYKSSHSDGEEGPQQETVNCDQIRPHPPEMEGNNFYLLEKVDVFHGSCWWVGLVTKLLEGKKYIVTLRHKKEMEFSNSELRPHLEWIDGQWVTKSKGVTFTSDSQEQTECALHENSCSTVDNTGKEGPYLGDKEDHQKELSTCV
ncbi:DUF724 domain-containing protein 6 [Morus notabilis]|uniref:DUF724 domain-containing protein 6 n=1 Tax=Morus notabilis TaxID=981085 RepID=UPI000CED096B|nr:DUF724 domain-containing protein 6 [Morus notabilis]